MRNDMVPGAIFPDCELSDHTAKRRKLSDLQGRDPMVLVLSRGAYCPKDRRQAQRLLELHAEMEVGYCRFVTISLASPRPAEAGQEQFVRAGSNLPKIGHS
jgi:peroxiredoxin